MKSKFTRKKHFAGLERFHFISAIQRKIRLSGVRSVIKRGGC